jgi:TonB family protein
MPCSRRSLSACLILAFFPVLARSQEPISPSSNSSGFARIYENSPDGLRWQLQDMLNAAKSNNRARLESLIKETEIPDYPGWFKRMFGQDKGEGRATAYANDLSENEKNLADVMMRLAEEDGEFVVRKIGEVPAPARNIDGGMDSSLQRRVNIFFASWKQRDSTLGSSSAAVGYFVFLEGKFGWDSASSVSEIQKLPDSQNTDLQMAPSSQLPGEQAIAALRDDQNAFHPGVGGVGYPKCDNHPDAKYTKLARKKQLQGTVTLQGIVRTDGQVADVHVLKSPDPELSKMAVEGVSQWRCEAARGVNGKPVSTIVFVELHFRLVK